VSVETTASLSTGRADAGALRGQETAGEHRSGHEQHRGDRHLAHHQPVAQRPAVAADAGQRLLSSKIADEIRPGRMQSGREPGQHARDAGGGQREQQYARVDSKVEGERDRNRQLHRGGHGRDPPGE
jgi:hypothetical protein